MELRSRVNGWRMRTHVKGNRDSSFGKSGVGWRLEELKHLCLRLGILEAGTEWPVSGHTGQAFIIFIFLSRHCKLPLEGRGFGRGGS